MQPIVAGVRRIPVLYMPVKHPRFESSKGYEFKKSKTKTERTKEPTDECVCEEPLVQASELGAASEIGGGGGGEAGVGEGSRR